MNIDRTHFLLITVALAAGPTAAGAAACTSNDTTTTDGGTGQPDATAGDDSGDDGSKGDASGNDGGDGGTGCDDTVAEGGALHCNAYGPDAALDGGCGVDPRMPGFCNALEANMKQKLANAAVDCLAISSACEGLDNCVLAAVANACPDPAATQACANLLASCTDAGTPEAGTGTDAGDFTSACQGLMSGLTQAGRAKLSDCYVNGGCADFPACTGALGQ
jgi:hypothetical protein